MKRVWFFNIDRCAEYERCIGLNKWPYDGKVTAYAVWLYWFMIEFGFERL